MKTVALVLLAVCALVYLGNASWLRGRGDGGPVILAHRGVAQQFSREGLTRDTCTATRMLPPTHGYLENTLPSIRAAKAYGADIVEIDVHPTIDGEFAVFHDWTVDCRTNGTGVTRRQSMAYLRTLDLGYGYTADGGQTFPFRGRYIGAMPTLGEVLAAFPSTRFLINIKSKDASEGERLAAYLANRRIEPDRLMFYGAEPPMARLRQRVPGARALSKSTLKRCLTAYLATGWTGHTPSACRDSVIFVPSNLRGLLWGWPNLFVARMKRAGSEVFVVGPLTRETGGSGSTALDTPAAVEPFAHGYAGGLSTDRIDVVGPYLRKAARPPKVADR